MKNADDGQIQIRVTANGGNNTISQKAPRQYR